MENGLRFSLAEDENILAYDKKNKVSYCFCLVLGVLTVLFFMGVFVISACALTKFGVDEKISFLAPLFLLFAIVLCFGLKAFINGFKFNKLYLTNQRFIVITKNNIDSIEFFNVKDIYSSGSFLTSVLTTQDKRRYKFFCSDLSDVVKKFYEIYPEYKKQQPSKTVTSLLFLGLIVFDILYFYFKCKS